jgi:hypothetical protein
MSLIGRPGVPRPAHRHVEAAHAGRLWAGLVAAAVVLAACGTSTPTGSPATSGSLPSAAPASATSPISSAPAAGSPSAASDALVAPTSEPAQTVKVALVACPTTFGMPGESLPPVPASMTATLSSDVAALVSFYGNGTLTLLGPTGWRCTAAIGADGSASMSLTPPGQAQPPGSPPADYQAVTASSGGACVGCIAQTACAIFPEAWKLFATPGQACPNTIPSTERITRPMPQSAVFEDPPGTAGTGDPSGGTYRALGYLVFDPGSESEGSDVRLPSALKVTCTLPDALAPICDETVEGAREPSLP